MKDDMTDFAEPFHQIVLSNPDHDSTHHAAKCMKRGSNDLGHEGAVLFKANGKYYLSAADEYEGRYSSCVAMSDNIYGPYCDRHETVPCSGRQKVPLSETDFVNQRLDESNACWSCIVPGSTEGGKPVFATVKSFGGWSSGKQSE